MGVMKTAYETLKEWRENNPDKVKLQRRRYQIRNWDKVREYQRLWQQKKRNADKQETPLQPTGTW